MKQQLDILEQRFQALRNQIGDLPGARETLAPALEEVAQGIAMVRRAQGEEVVPADSETNLQHIFAAIPDLLTVDDEDLNVIMSNWHGYEFVSPEERRSRPKCYQVFLNRDRPCEPCVVQKVFATGQAVTQEVFNPVDGQTREIQAFPVCDQSGHATLVAKFVRNITKSKQVEKALQEREALYRALTEESLVGVYLIQDGKFRYVNPVLAQIFGYTPAELIDRLGPWDLTHPDDHTFLDERIRQRLAGEIEEANSDLRGLRRDGAVIHFTTLSRRVEYRGQPAIIGTLLDISDHKQMEDALKEREELYSVLSERSLVGVYLIQDGIFRYVNPVLAQMFGYTPEEMIGRMGPMDTTHPDDLPWLGEQIRLRLAGEIEETRGTLRGLRQDGSVIHFEGLGRRIDYQGRPAIIGTLLDITERKEAQEALQASETKYRELVENANSIILRWDPQGRITFSNKFAQELFGYSEQEILGKNLVGTIVPTIESSGRNLAALLKNIEHRPDDYRINENENITKSGKRLWVSWTNKGIYDPEGNLAEILSIGIDTTARKEAEQALEFRAQLLDVARDAIMAHDLEGSMVYVNKAAGRASGYTKAELLGKNILDLSAPGEHRQESLQRLRDLRVGKDLEPFESVHVRKDGTQFPIEVYGRLSQVEGKKIFLGVARDITGRQLAEEALRESEARYRTLFETSPHGIALMDLQMNITMANQQGLRLFGFNSPEEVLAKNGLDFIAPEDLPFIQRLSQEMFKTGETQTADVRLVRKDGTRLSCLITASLVRDAAGEPQAIIGVAQDITDLKRAEEAVQESEARLRAIFDHAPVGITMLDASGRFLQTNPAFQAIVGYNAAELQNLTCPQITHPEDMPEEAERHRKLFAGERQFYSIEKRYLRKDGRVVWTSVMMAHLLNAQGEPRGVGTIIDITARKQAQKALRESEQRFRLMAETIQDAFWIGTASFDKLLYVSPGYERIWGHNGEELSASPQTFMDAVHPEDLERVQAHLTAILAQPVPWNHEYRIIKPNGEVRWIQDRGFPVTGEQGQVILFTGVSTDITERKTLERQLLLAQRMEAVGRLAGGVAHDFNNLLMAIMSYAELMREQVLKGDPLYSYLEDILKATDRATALTKQLLTFSRQQIVNPQVIDLNRLVLDLKRMLRRLIEEDIEFKIITAPHLGMVRADPGYLNQIIMNLVINARDALPGGGQIIVETGVVDFETGHQTRFGVAPPGSYVILRVSDTGSGMDESIQAHIFEPFFTTKDPGKGTGLGLSIVYGIIQQSGGFIDLQSEPGCGSTFTIYLPRLDAAMASAPVKKLQMMKFRGEETILLVEDEEVLRNLLTRFLRLHGYTVLQARHGDEALEICARHQGPIHIMVTDVVMPQMSGRILADRLSSLRPEMKVLYMSGYAADEVIQRGVADLAVAFLQKPFKPIDLALQIRAILHPPKCL